MKAETILIILMAVIVVEDFVKKIIDHIRSKKAPETKHAYFVSYVDVGRAASTYKNGVVRSDSKLTTYGDISDMEEKIKNLEDVVDPVIITLGYLGEE